MSFINQLSLSIGSSGTPFCRLPLILRWNNFSLLFFGLVFFGASPAFASYGCGPYEEPIVEVRPLVQEPMVDFSRSLPDLVAMASQGSDKFSSTGHEFPVGLTAASLKLDSHFEVLTKSKASDPMVCAQISRFTLGVGFEGTTVYVAREIPYGTCGYQIVFDHEMQHVNIDRTFAVSYAEVFPSLLRDFIRDIGVIRASSADMAQDRIRAIVNAYMDGTARNLSLVRSRKQEVIDTKDEYSRLSHACGGELSRLVGRYKIVPNNTQQTY